MRNRIGRRKERRLEGGSRVWKKGGGGAQWRGLGVGLERGWVVLIDVSGRG